jgi:hypothetical protein
MSALARVFIKVSAKPQEGKKKSDTECTNEIE